MAISWQLLVLWHLHLVCLSIILNADLEKPIAIPDHTPWILCPGYLRSYHVLSAA